MPRWPKDYAVAENGCWNWLGVPNSHGYGRITVNYKEYGAHRWSYMHHKGDIPEGLQVLHTCDNRLCVNPDHLFLGTIGDNMRDRTAKKRQAKGESQGLSKLTQEDVDAIRRSHLKQTVLASAFGVTQANISSIKRYKTWKDTTSAEMACELP